jgi:hypothetical protein
MAVPILSSPKLVKDSDQIQILRAKSKAGKAEVARLVLFAGPG